MKHYSKLHCFHGHLKWWALFVSQKTMTFIDSCTQNFFFQKSQCWLWFYGISTIVGYLMLNPVYTYMICKHILLITFLNEPELIFFCTQLDRNTLHYLIHNFVYYKLFVCTQLNDIKYCYVSVTIQLNISHLFTNG